MNALLASALVVLYHVVKNLVHSHTFLLRVAESLDSLLVVFNLPDFLLQELLRLLLIPFPCGLADLLSAQVEGTPPKLTAWMLVQSAVASHPALLSLRQAEQQFPNPDDMRNLPRQKLNAAPFIPTLIPPGSFPCG